MRNPWRASLMISSACLSATMVLGAAKAVDNGVPRVWKNPGRIESLDLYYGPGGRVGVPRPPFRFIRKESTGTAKKVLVLDSRNRTWEVKFGHEAKPDVFATRIAWALGYYADTTYLVRSGRINGEPFRDAKFELRDPYLTFRPDLKWSWKKNPFIGTRELNGLRMLVMLLSDWDNKDARDPESNIAVLQTTGSTRPQSIYYVDDWGASMGKWGGYFTREKWDCDLFAKQTSTFIKGLDGREVEWGFKGQHTGDFKDDLTVADARWFMTYLGRLRDAQIRSALRSAGASPHEVRCFTTSLRQRIDLLRRMSYPRSARAALRAR